jgi:hypothetical protein
MAARYRRLGFHNSPRFQDRLGDESFIFAAERWRMAMLSRLHRLRLDHIARACLGPALAHNLPTARQIYLAINARPYGSRMASAI